jgi:hypothetical protein
VLWFINLLLQRLNESLFLEKNLVNNGIETKKCLNCLRRCESYWNNCPYCGYTDFDVNEN